MIPLLIWLLSLSAVLSFAAACAERVCEQFRYPCRGVWLLAAGLSVCIPTLSLFGYLDLAASPLGLQSIELAVGEIAAGRHLPESRQIVTPFEANPIFRLWASLSALDGILATLWVMSSVAVMLTFAMAATRLHLRLRSAMRKRIDGCPVWVTDDIGPAVFGVLRPRIVIPSWIASGEPSRLRIVLAHEKAHMQALDYWAIRLVLLPCILTPWNAFAWWQLRRLRAAVEIDCDRRVLRAGIHPYEYSQVLIDVGSHFTATSYITASMAALRSELERRISIMNTRVVRPNVWSNSLRIMLTALLAASAVFVGAPGAQQSEESPRDLPRMSEAIYQTLNAAIACTEASDFECARRLMREVRQGELNGYEAAQYWNFMAFVEYSEGDIANAVADYENVLRQRGLPQKMREDTMYTLAQLYVQLEQFEQAYGMLGDWFSNADESSPEQMYLRAVLEYRLEMFEAALTSLNLAISQSPGPAEHWYSLLLGLQTALDDRRGAIETLELLNANWPNEERRQELALRRSQR